MKKLLLLVGLMWAAVASAQFTPGQLLTAAELNNQFSLYAPLAGATYSGPVTIPSLTVSTTFSMPASTVIPSGVTATTQSFSDNSTLVATSNFVKRTLLASQATIPISNVTGGTYNFATAGSNVQIVILASGGTISSVLAIAVPGSGYQVGDCLVMVGGNGDAILRVTSLSGSGVATASVVYGGTGYTTGAQLTGAALPPGTRTGNITGTLTSPLLIIIPSGTLLQGARFIGLDNNTTGAFTSTVKLSNGSGGSTGTGIVLPQGTANSTSVTLYTDGVTDVWLADTPAGIGALSASSGSVPLTSLAVQAANTVVANATGGSASPTAISAPSCSTSASALKWVSGAGFTCNTAVNAAQLGGGTFGAPGPIGATTPSTGVFTSLATTGWVEATALGFVGDNSTDNTSALATLAANASAPHIYWPPGTYRFNSCAGVSFAAPVVWKGGPGSIIKFVCTMPAFPTGVLGSNGKAIYMDGMTFDMSSMSNTGGIGTTTFNPFLYIQNLSGFWIQNNNFLISPSQTASLFLNNDQNGWVTGNYFSQTAASRNANQCISMTNSGGLNTGVTIAHNTCLNTAMFVTGAGLKIIGNDISGWGYGSGITNGGVPDTAGSGWNEIVGNYTHNSQPWRDANLAEPSGVESWLPHSNITANVVNTVSGSAIGGGGLNTTIASNDLLNWGTCTDAGCAGVITYGIELDYVSASYNGSNDIIVGNKESNPAAALTAYGYGENASGMTGISISGNTFSSVSGNFPYSQVKGTLYTGTDIWNSFTSVLTPAGGTGVSLVLNNFRYNIQGHTVHFTMQVQVNYTTPPTSFTFTIPFAPNMPSVATGVDTAANHFMSGVISSTTVTMAPTSAFTASGDFVLLSGQYDTQ